MGNRAVVIFEDQNSISPAIYLHWNGGPESIYCFLDECERRYGIMAAFAASARFTHVVGDFFDQDRYEGLCLCFQPGPEEITLEEMAYQDPGDNGVFVVSWKGDKRFVRRFKGDWTRDGETVELSTEEVKKEREEAYSHAYRTDPEGIMHALANVRQHVVPTA